MSETAEPKITQPELRPLEPGERYVRTGGLKYILPTVWVEGDVLSAEAAVFINTALHTSVLNRFKDTRKVLEENPSTTYDDIDKALREFFATFSIGSRPTKAPDPVVEEDAEDVAALKALIKWARPQYNKAMTGLKLPRKDYEEFLRTWVLENRSDLQAQMDVEKDAIDATIKLLAESLGAEQ